VPGQNPGGILATNRSTKNK